MRHFAIKEYQIKGKLKLLLPYCPFFFQYFPFLMAATQQESCTDSASCTSSFLVVSPLVRMFLNTFNKHAT